MTILKTPTLLLAASIAILLAPGALAQEHEPDPDCEDPEALGCEPEPDCEQDPNQMGCDPECADPNVSCHHPPCPTSLHGQALPNGENFMSWTLNSLNDVHVYRAEGDGEFELTDRHEFPRTKHLDRNAEPGVTYRYQVTVVNETGFESPACETIEITTIPVFPTPVALVAATALGTLGYVAVRRRA